MKVTQKAKRSAFLAAIFTCAASLACGFALLKPNQPTATAESVDAATTAVYDYHDLTGQYYRVHDHGHNIHEGTGAAYLGSIAEEDKDDFVVQWKIQTLQTRTLNIGILVNGAYDTWGAGYWLTLDGANGAALAYTNCGGVSDNVFNVPESDRLDVADTAECAVLYQGAFDFEFGSKVTDAGRYVFVKINGDVLLESTDTQVRDLGDRVNADTHSRCSFASLKEQTDLTGVTTYDIHDLAGKYTLSLTDDWGIGQTAENANVEYTTIIKPVNGHGDMPIAILGGADNDYGYAYRAIVNATSGIRLVYGCIATGITETWSNEYLGGARTLAYGVDEPTTAYLFTLGAKTLSNCTYVYVKINGETVLTAYDPIRSNMGKWVSAGKYNKAEFFSTKIEKEELTTYDLYDLTGSYERGLYPDDMVLGTPEEKSISFKTLVTLQETFNASEFGISLFSASTDTWGDSHVLYFTSDYRIKYAGINTLGHASGNNIYVAQTDVLDEMKTTFELEFGVQRLIVENSVFGYASFVKVNGKMVIEYIEYTNKNVTPGVNVVANTAARCTFTSTKVVTEANAILENVDFTMDFGASVRMSQPTGLRFTAVISEADYLALVNNAQGYQVSFGMLITPEDVMAKNGELTLENAKYTVGQNLMNIPCENILFVEDEENGNFYEIRGVISDIKEQNYARNFVGRAYVTLTKNGVSVNAYADYHGGDVKNNTRSVYEVAAKALIEGEDSSVLEAFVAVVEANFTFTVEAGVVTVEVKDGCQFANVYLPKVYYDKASGELFVIGE